MYYVHEKYVNYFLRVDQNMESDNEPEPPPPPDYNRNIFKIYFYHYAANGWNDLLTDHGRIRHPGIPELRIRHSAVLVKIGRTDVRGW